MLRKIFAPLVLLSVVATLVLPSDAFAFGRRKPKPKPTPTPTCCAFEVEVFDGDPSSGQHLSGAQVKVGDQLNTSDANGKAAFTVSRGHHLIQVDLAGYQHYEFDHDIQNDAVGANAFTMSLERVPVAAPPTVSLTGKPASTISTRSATFTFSASGGEAPLRFRCSMDEFGGGPVDENCVSPKTFSNLDEGNRGFRLRVIDRLGRSSETVLYRFDVDTSGPVVTITSAPPASTQATTASFSFSSPDAGGGFECKLDGAGFAACSSPKAYSNVAVGAHTFQVRAKDGAGNIGAAATASWAVNGETQFDQSFVLSSWTAPFPNGWFPQLSADGRYVTCGFGETFLAELSTNRYQKFDPPVGGQGFGGYWIRPGVFTFMRETSNSQALRFEVSVSDWVARQMPGDPTLIHGSEFKAADGHWASYRLGRIVYDGAVVEQSPDAGGALTVSQNRVAHAIFQGGANVGIRVLENGQFLRNYPAFLEPHQMNMKNGYIAYGGYGPIRGIDPAGNDTDLTIAPWRWEGTATVFFVGSQPWIATATIYGASQRGLILIRPWGARDAIVLEDGDAAGISVVENGGILTVAMNDPKGRLRIRTLPVNSPRTLLPTQ